MKRPDLQAAIARLASLYEYGALSASTQPVVFIDTVTDDVEKLRVENDRLEALFQQHHGVHSYWVWEGTNLRSENARLRDLLREWFDCDTVAKSADWQTRARAALETK